MKEMKAAESFASHPSSFNSLVSVFQTNAPLRGSEAEDREKFLAIGAQINQHPSSLMRTGHGG